MYYIADENNEYNFSLLNENSNLKYTTLFDENKP